MGWDMEITKNELFSGIYGLKCFTTREKIQFSKKKKITQMENYKKNGEHLKIGNFSIS